MSTRERRKPSAKKKNFGLTRKSLIYAIGIHIVIAVLLLVSFNFNTGQTKFSAAGPKTQPIQATAVAEVDLKKQLQMIEDRENKKKLERQEAEKKVQELKLKQQQEQEKLARIKREQELLKKKQADEKKAELARKKKAEEKKQAELAKKKKEDEMKKAELARKKKAEEKKKAELARKKKEEEERKQAELAARVEAERQQRMVSSALNQYIPIITQKVSRNWNKPASVQRGITAKVAVRLTPSGEVVSAELIRSSGNSVFDRSVVNAVYKASPLPIPQERGVNERFRELDLNFNPEDLI
jgi:colicin import membrane protein